MAGEFCWVEMLTDDRLKAQSYYADLFGWSFEEVATGAGPYAMFRPAPGGPGGGIMARPAGDMPTAWTPYVAVDDVDASAARARELGGRVLAPPADVPGYGRFAVIQDPTGGVLGLWRCAE